MAQRLGPPGLKSAPARRDRDPSGWDGIEVVPDSEEERIRDGGSGSAKEIFEISSDEDDRLKGKGRLENPKNVPGAWIEDPNPSPSKKAGRTLKTLATPTPKKATAGTPSKKKLVSQTPGTPTSSKKNAPSTLSKRPSIVESTSADAAADQVVVAELEWPTPKSTAVPAKHLYKRPMPAAHISAGGTLHVTDAADESDSDIEIISGPAPSPKPTVQPTQLKPKPKPKPKTKLRPLYDDDDGDRETSDTSSSEESSGPGTPPLGDVANKYAKYWTPSATRGTTTGRKVATPSRASGSKSPKKLSQAALMKLDAQAEAARLAEYAEQVYTWVNRRVFEDRLPSLDKIEIKWNTRLLTTAGKARFHRDRDGNEFVDIELATKILDCEERVRNTLSHEMCHLACWIIDGQIKESHGKLFHKWARRVERKDPVIEISVEHTYDIYYPFEWECANCDMLTGRYTNSLDPTVTKCKWCKTGALTPTFDPEPPKAVSKISKMAAAKPQGSPHRPGPRSASPIFIESSDEDEPEPPAFTHLQKEIYVVHDSDSESDENDQSITDLARKFEGITIAHKVCSHAKRATRARRSTKV